MENGIRTKLKSKNPCGQSFWMCMPSMGETLANAFQSPIFFSLLLHPKNSFLISSLQKMNPPFSLLHLQHL
ncbi:hypothetical protein VP01_3249g2 [Puccinia sorghi]|uniref:Uncharacterized protein n=1 Tax=Puccinia sorghi TaxID=27349 RepID=A0A0L6UZY1_9BASI|nr:hypothetical protein VP01_3249g2 [Puccinia sorghi]